MRVGNQKFIQECLRSWQLEIQLGMLASWQLEIQLGMLASWQLEIQLGMLARWQLEIRLGMLASWHPWFQQVHESEMQQNADCSN